MWGLNRLIVSHHSRFDNWLSHGITDENKIQTNLLTFDIIHYHITKTTRYKYYTKGHYSLRCYSMLWKNFKFKSKHFFWLHLWHIMLAMLVRFLRHDFFAKNKMCCRSRSGRIPLSSLTTLYFCLCPRRALVVISVWKLWALSVWNVHVLLFAVLSIVTAYA